MGRLGEGAERETSVKGTGGWGGWCSPACQAPVSALAENTQPTPSLGKVGSQMVTSCPLVSRPHSGWPTPKPTHPASSVPICLVTSSRTAWSTSCPTRAHGSVFSPSGVWRAPTTLTPASLMATGTCPWPLQGPWPLPGDAEAPERSQPCPRGASSLAWERARHTLPVSVTAEVEGIFRHVFN